jgi:ABC-type enterochelin transport system substrate-binding protein
MQSITELRLPDHTALRDYDGDLIVTGPGLTPDLYEQIKENLPLATRARLIGWRTTAKRRMNHV